MDLKLNLDLKNFDIKKVLPILSMLQPYLVGLALIGVFAYTSLVVNTAIQTKPANIGVSAATAAPKITFDKPTIDAVKNLEEVQGVVPTGDLGTSNPFN